MTLKKGLNLLVAFAPAAIEAYISAEQNGGITTKAGFQNGFLASLVSSYTGYDIAQKKFTWKGLLVGYGPIVADVFAARKLINRAPTLKL